MKQSGVPPVYLQVAFDIAAKIVSGELKEGERFSGRSLMGSRYGVSSETIRRGMALLKDLGIVSVQANSGSQVLSKKRAKEYVDQYQAGRDLWKLKTRLRELTAQRDALNEEINRVFNQISDLQMRFHTSDRIRTYKFELSESSAVIGKSIGELCFRQETGGTIVAIQREGEILFSPGPQTIFAVGDILTIACEFSGIERISAILN
ncbi:MAG: GntR family transcriptional regulator [Lachnospiraceae bacterium]|nr:GntR family transcriptional regulator [Lachnospiraceae bacterium]